MSKTKTVSIDAYHANLKTGEAIKATDTYYIDKVPEVKYEKQLCEMNVKLFNKRYMDSFTLGFAYSDMGAFKYPLPNNKKYENSYKEQPSFWDIAKALLWGYGDYSIKQGCFTDGTGYVSSFTTTIDENGCDKDVVLIKKWSMKLEEVYIYIEDIEQLCEKTESKSIKYERESTLYCQMIKAIVRTRLHYTSKDALKRLSDFMENDQTWRLKTETEKKDFILYKKCLEQSKSFDTKMRLEMLSKFKSHTEESISDYINYKTVYRNTEGREKHFADLLEKERTRLSIIESFIAEIESGS